MTAKFIGALCLPVVMMGCVSTQQVADMAHKHLKVGKKKSLAAQAEQQAAEAEAAKSKLPSKQDIQVPIGTVHMVDQVGRFILIKSSRTTSLDADTQIISYGPDAQMSSHLKASPARKGAYLTADMVDGIPSVGDMVMMVKSIGNKPTAGAPELPGGPIQVLE